VRLPGVEILPVGTRRALRQFIDFPYRLYKDDPYWVPPLRIAQRELFDKHKHPFHAHAEVQCFLALQNQRPVGRIAAILDRNFNEFHHEQAGAFGCFETINSQEVAAALLHAAQQWLRERGAHVMRGPMNPSTNYECGLLVDGFNHSPRLMMTYNFPFYGQLIEKTGLWKAKDLYAYHGLPPRRQTRLLNYADCEYSWVFEDNTVMLRSMETLGATRYKTYRIYEWH
jgi:hypothetical protein